jgi:DivIVA domain-containing protein
MSMSLTPEEIRERSFATRFRGADPAEVGEFLRRVAVQFSDLQYRVAQQHKKIEEQEHELELAADDKKSFDDVLGAYKANIEQLRSELSSLRDQDLRRAAKYGQLKKQREIDQQERQRLAEKLSGAETVISELERKLRLSQGTVEELRTAVVQLEADKGELEKQNGHDAETIAQARLEMEELFESSRLRARQLLADAKERIEEQRARAVQEIAGLRQDIEGLRNRRKQLSDDLKTMLNSHLEWIDAEIKKDRDSAGNDYDELFQKIDFTEVVEFDLGDAGEVLLDDQLNGQVEKEDTEDRLKRTLKDGGVAYLSDE